MCLLASSTFEDGHLTEHTTTGESSKTIFTYFGYISLYYLQPLFLVQFAAMAPTFACYLSMSTSSNGTDMYVCLWDEKSAATKWVPFLVSDVDLVARIG